MSRRLSNTPAVELYSQQGFRTTRALACFQIDKMCTGMQSFLHTLGFEHFIDQYEMLLPSPFFLLASRKPREKTP
ncbi:MAG: hypothetical protein ACOC7X_04700 [Spirochaetota bacterium]